MRLHELSFLVCFLTVYILNILKDIKFSHEPSVLRLCFCVHHVRKDFNWKLYLTTSTNLLNVPLCVVGTFMLTSATAQNAQRKTNLLPQRGKHLYLPPVFVSQLALYIITVKTIYYMNEVKDFMLGRFYNTGCFVDTVHIWGYETPTAKWASILVCAVAEVSTQSFQSCSAEGHV